MADKEDKDSKRKRDLESSVSEHDTSTDSSALEKEKQKKKKKKEELAKQKNKDKVIETKVNESDKEKVNIMKTDKTDKSITKQLTEMNKKLENVITKDDASLKDLIKKLIQDMKTEIVASVTHRIEILETKLFEKEKENDSLKETIESMITKVEEQKNENKTLKNELEKANVKIKGKVNALEQYGRRNSIRIYGVPEQGSETAEETSNTVINLLNHKIDGLNLTSEKIDIAHRLGDTTYETADGKKKTSNRQIIVKFVSRTTREKVMKNKKNMKGSNMFIGEDLTPINNLVLTCIRKKMKDEVEQVWSKEGRLFYKNKHDHIHQVKSEEYQYWLDLKWPEKDY